MIKNQNFELKLKWIEENEIQIVHKKKMKRYLIASKRVCGRGINEIKQKKINKEMNDNKLSLNC